jgi:nitroreductase
MPTRRDLLATLAAPALTSCAGGQGYEAAVRDTWRHTDGMPEGWDSVLRELVRYATLAANGHNTQPWRFRLRERGLDVLPDPTRRTPVVDPDDHHLWASLGCALENVAQAAQAFGLQAEASVDDGAIRVELMPGPPLDSELFGAIPRRQSTRADYDGHGVDVALLRKLQAAGSADTVQCLLLTGRNEIDRVAEAVVAGNSAQMADPAFVAELKAWIRFGEPEALLHADGLFSRSSGNPALPRWLGERLFDLVFTARTENDKYARQLRSSAGVAVFSAASDDAAGWVAAGRACQRFLLQASALDLRTAFINQPVEVASLRRSFAGLLGLGSRRPDLVLRFGRGPRLPASLRRPVQAVISSP